MRSNFMDSGMEELQNLLADFYTLTEMKICIYNADGEEIGFYPHRYSDFCHALRQEEAMTQRCLECDRLSREKCRLTKKIQVYTCHAGLTECVTPILMDGIILGYIVFGQVRTAQQDGERWKGTPLHQAFLNLHIASREKVASAAHILEVIASYDSLRKYVASQSPSAIHHLTTYIDQHIGEDLGIESLCHAFSLSRRELYRIFRDKFSCTPADYIRQRRLDQGATLLISTDLPIKEIALRCGIWDYNYFTKCFHAAFHLSPRDYRKRFRP